MSELLPCPFCGGDAKAIPQPAEGVPRVICLGKGCWGKNAGKDINEAIAAWNRRVSPTIPHRGVVNAADQPHHMGR